MGLQHPLFLCSRSRWLRRLPSSKHGQWSGRETKYQHQTLPMQRSNGLHIQVAMHPGPSSKDSGMWLQQLTQFLIWMHPLFRLVWLTGWPTWSWELRWQPLPHLSMGSHTRLTWPHQTHYWGCQPGGGPARQLGTPHGTECPSLLCYWSQWKGLPCTWSM